MSHLSLIVLLSALALAACQDKYTDKYDDVNLDEILNNNRLYRNYFNCVMGEGKCTPDGQELRDRIPDGLKNNCAKCNEKQKRGTEKILRFMITKKPEDFKRVEAKFDPEGVYRKKYDEQYKLIAQGKKAL